MQKEQNHNLFNFVKERISILQVVSEHVSLKKAGLYWKGCCPFHGEKTASFTVSPHREIFYCFGCHMGGDVITFISKVENCTVLEAAKQLADRYNIAIPEAVFMQASEQKTDEKKRYYELCQLFAQWAHTQLLKHPSIVSYLNKRGFTAQSLETFTVGYFPEGERNFKSLVTYVNTHNFIIKDLLEAHLVEDGKGTLYSPFEQRIIFPIKDHMGRFCGFGGRVIKPEDQRSKYYNSRENHYFQKGSILFGLDLAKKEIQKKGTAFLVEGYTDCIAMVQHGFGNTIATLGTSCTVEHLKLLAHHAHTVYLLYDGDAAGQKAMLRLAQLCWQVNLDLMVIFLPEGQDPASFLESGKSLEPLIGQAQDVLSFFLTNSGKEFAQQGLQQKLHGMREFLDIIKNLDDKLKQDILLQKAALTFSLPFASLQDELKKISLAPRYNKPEKEEEAPLSDPHEEISVIEKKFIYGILNDTVVLQKEEVAQIIEYLPLVLKNFLKKLGTQNPLGDKKVFLSFFDTLEEEEKRLVSQILLEQKEDEELDFEQLLLLLEKKYWKMIVNGTKLKIAAAQTENDVKRVDEVVVSFLTLKKKLLRKGLI